MKTHTHSWRCFCFRLLAVEEKRDVFELVTHLLIDERQTIHEAIDEKDVQTGKRTGQLNEFRDERSAKVKIEFTQVGKSNGNLLEEFLLIFSKILGAAIVKIGLFGRGKRNRKQLVAIQKVPQLNFD